MSFPYCLFTEVLYTVLYLEHTIHCTLQIKLLVRYARMARSATKEQLCVFPYTASFSYLVLPSAVPDKSRMTISLAVCWKKVLRCCRGSTSAAWILCKCGVTFNFAIHNIFLDDLDTIGKIKWNILPRTNYIYDQFKPKNEGCIWRCGWGNGILVSCACTICTYILRQIKSNISIPRLSCFT